MVTLPDLRSYMRNRVTEDRNRKSVQVTADSIESGLQEASIELGLPVKKLEYEVIQKGSGGILGLSKKEYILLVYEALDKTEIDTDKDDLGIDFDSIGEQGDEPVDRDGEIIVRLSGEGALLKITPPIGNGSKATERLTVEKIERRGILDYDRSLVADAVKRADGQSVRIGEFSYNPANDSLLSLDVDQAEMKAFMSVQQPGPGGIDQSADSIISFLKSNNVIHGIKEDVITDFEDHPRYNEKIVVAEGTSAEEGENAKIIFSFEADTSKIKLKEKNGRVDFKEMNLVQNVVEGQILAKKTPPGEGKSGRTIKGKAIPANRGNDVQIGIGKNVQLSEDGMSAKSTINGQVIIANEKINVEPIYVVQGDVNLKTGGNVIFLGAVIVKGSVDDGFKVKASGNIEVMGNVGKAELDSEGEIIVHQGITGKGGGKIRSGKSVWAKFIEHANVESEEHVVASDGIINSHVIANKRIICQGKRATIVGGSLKAAEEIHAKTLGSIAGSETVLEVGYDPKSKEKLAQIEEKIQAIDNQLDEINLNIQTLENLKKTKKELPEEKETFLSEQIEKKADITGEKQKHLEEVKEIQEYLNSLKITGKISAGAKVFPGVRIFIKEAFLEVRNDFSEITFINEANVVKPTKYEPIEEEYVRKK